jgi:hypothetical protein
MTTFLVAALLVLTSTSCHTEMPIGDGYNAPTSNEVLVSNEVWCVELNSKQENPNLPFMTRAFTLSFDLGTLYANKSLEGIYSAVAGLGIDVGSYQTIYNQLAIDRDIDGLHDFEVRVGELDRLN